MFWGGRGGELFSGAVDSILVDFVTLSFSGRKKRDVGLGLMCRVGIAELWDTLRFPESNLNSPRPVSLESRWGKETVFALS